MIPADRPGYFGAYGGRFIPETLSFALEELARAYDEARVDPAFLSRLEDLLTNYVGRATPLYFAERLTGHAGGARIFLKREDLNHTGAHKINNAIGQALLAKRLGKARIIAETGAGQHGVATATACALLALPCRVFMGEVDVARQRPNVQRMELLGARVIPVDSGSRTLKDAINAAMRQWVTDVRDTHYLVGSVVGPDPFPRMVRDFQSVIGRETRTQCLDGLGRLPDLVIACVGGGSNAIGMFHPLLDDPIALVGVEAAGHGVDTAQHAATLTKGRPGVLHGARTVLLQDEDGQIQEAHSISAGLDYPGVGPEHAHLRDIGRVRYESITDAEALGAFRLLARLEGIVPALESAHAVAFALKAAADRPKDQVVVVNLSGRGDKDLDHVIALGAGGEGMSLARMFEAVRSRNEIALIPYVTAGYPTLHASLDFIDQAAAAGADAIEIGLPFSDPVADGPTIQFASHEALQAGFRTRAFLEALSSRRRPCPLILMTYLNPLLALGPSAFSILAVAGISAVVIPDLPEEEAAPVIEDAARFGIDVVLLVAPTSSDDRLRRIGSTSRGFVYVVGVVGTTGARREADPALPRILDRVRGTTTLPLVAGFGLSEPAHIQAITSHAEGAIVGSRLVDAIRGGEDFAALIRSFKQATRRH